MLAKLLPLALLCLSAASSASNSALELVQHAELVNLFRTEKYVVVLFTVPHCPECDKLERQLVAIRDELVDSLNAWVVKVLNCPIVRLYSPRPEPVVVFFRSGVPLLYDGPLDDDELILHTFLDNREPLTKELTDDNFEHLTQAATGATTGDWFVLFYSQDCVECQNLQARWEAVGAQLKSRMNVARVNRGTTGAATARRFEVFGVPAFLYFRQGKLYRYDLGSHDVASFVSFAKEFYKNMKPEKVPVAKSPFDDLVAMVADYLRQNPWMWQVGFCTFLFGLLMSLLARKLNANAADKKAKVVKDKEEKKKAK